MNRNISGVYAIKNKINEKSYIGSSKNIKNRWYKHKRMLGRKNHTNIKLQNAWNKYGEEKFEFKILEKYNDLNKLYEIEQVWIDKFDSVKNGYNINSKAGVFLEKYREKISKKLKGRKFSEMHSFNKSLAQKGSKNPSARQINLYNIKGEYIKTFNTIKEASGELNIHKNHIIFSCKKRVFQTHGYIFRYSDEDQIGKNINVKKRKIKKPNLSLYRSGMKLSEETKKKISDVTKGKNNPTAKAINQYDLNGKFIKTWGFIREAQLSLGISTISQCAKQKRKSSGGFIWRYTNEYEIGKDLCLKK